MTNLDIVRYLNYIFALVFIGCIGYQFVYIFIPFLKGARKYKAKKLCKYAILIPGRNEEKVIPHLIASIKGQSYPEELLDIFVIADNCTDNTAKVSREAGAYHVIERFNDKLIGKGFALDYALNLIKKEFPDNHYDGFFVFDADNLLDENYIAEMNKMFSNGHRILTSYRDRKSVV